MNRNLGLIGQKLGNTQIFEDDGSIRRVTAVQMGPCTVVGIRTPDRHGYSALQLGFGSRKSKHVPRPEAAFFEKNNLKATQVVREFRVSEEVAAKYAVGQEVKASEVFEAGQLVDVSGTSKGRGFTGVMKRHNFKGSATVSHGNHEYKRHGGSIGQNMTPGHTFAGMRMCGQHGNARVTTLNIKIVKVLAAEGIVLVEGAVPGPRDGIVTLRGAVKKRAAAQA